MAGDRELRVRILGDASGAEKALGSLNASADKTESRFGKMAKGLALAGGAAALGIAKGAVDAAAESQKVSAQTEAVIKSTGGAAGVSVEQIGDLASKLQKLSGVEDEAIQTGQNMLLTFTNIKAEGGVFDQATRTALDMSVAMGTDAKSSAMQLGKALNDPIKGIGALSRVGVTFTDQQKEQIKALVASGDTMGAQKIILAELNKEFGGSAKAAGDAMTPVERLKLQFGDMQEKLGTALIPALTKLGEVISSVVTFLGNLPGPALAAIGVVAGLAATAFVVVKAVQAWTAVQAALNVVMALNPIGLIVIAIAALVAGIVIAYKNSETFRTIVQGAWDVLKGMAEFIAGVAVGAFNLLRGAVEGVVGFISRNWSGLLAILTNPIGAAVSFITGKLDTIVGFVGGLPGRIAAVAGGMFDGIKNAFRSAINWVIRAWNGLDFQVPGVEVFGKKIGGQTIGTPNIPLLASGGMALRPGLAVVGDDGPELAYMSRGATIAPLGRMGGVVNHYTIQVMPGIVGMTKAQIEEEIAAALVRFERRSGPVRSGR